MIAHFQKRPVLSSIVVGAIGLLLAVIGLTDARSQTSQPAGKGNAPAAVSTSISAPVAEIAKNAGIVSGPADPTAAHMRLQQVRVVWSKTHDSAGETSVSLGWRCGGWVKLLTNKDGYGSVPVPIEWDGVYVVARNSESAAITRTYNLPVGPVLEIELEKGASVAGKVLADGRPVAGAEVIAFRESGESNASTGLIGSSNEQGEYQVTGLHAVPMRFFARKGNLVSNLSYRQAPLLNVAKRGEHYGPVNLALQPGVSYTGRITDQKTQSAIPHARITATLGKLKISTVADAEGRYQLSGLTTDPLQFNISASGYIDQQMSVSPQLTLDILISTQDISLQKGVNCTLVVVDPEGKPIPGACVVAPPEFKGQLTDLQGKLKLPGLLAKPQTLYGFQEDRSSDTRVTLKSNDGSQITAKSITITRSTNANAGSELQNANKGANLLSNLLGPASLRMMSAPETPGFTVMTASTNSISIDKIGFLPLSVTADPAKLVNGELKVILQRVPVDLGYFAGTVRDANGKPLAGASVSCKSEHGGYAIEQKTVLTNEKGEYRLPVNKSALKGNESLFAYAPGFAPRQISLSNPGSQQSPTRVEFVLEKGHWIKGRVEDELGKHPAIKFETDEPFRHRDGWISDGGIFWAPDLDGSTVKATFGADGFKSTTLELPVDQEYRITLKKDAPAEYVVVPPTGSIAGLVLDSSTGKPVTSFTVTIDGQSRSFVSADGKFTFPGLSRGDSLTVTIESRNYRSRAFFNVELGEEGNGPERKFELSPVQ